MKRIIDLTLTLKHGMRGVAFETKYTRANKGWNAQTLHLYSHCGTHLDAPIHFEASHKTVTDIPLHRCISPAWVVNLAGIAPGALITVSDLGRISEKIQPGESLLIRTDWSERLGTPEYYAALPRVSRELAQWCVAHSITMLGVEPPAVADPKNIPEITEIHKILLAADIIIVEGLTNLKALTQEKVLFMAFPLKIEAGDGAPVRALAIENEGIDDLV